MKLKFLILACFLSMFGLSQAQYIGGGAVLGMNASQVDGDTYGGYKKVGLQLGGYAFYRFSERIQLQVEILYSNKGAREVEIAYAQVNLNYLDVPILANYRVFGDDSKGLVFQAGLIPSYLMSAKLGFKNQKADNSIFYRRFQVEGAAGAQFQLSKLIGVNFRGAISISNAGSTRFPWLTNRYFSLGLRIGGS